MISHFRMGCDPPPLQQGDSKSKAGKWFTSRYDFRMGCECDPQQGDSKDTKWLMSLYNFRMGCDPSPHI